MARPEEEKAETFSIPLKLPAANRDIFPPNQTSAQKGFNRKEKLPSHTSRAQDTHGNNVHAIEVHRKRSEQRIPAPENTLRDLLVPPQKIGSAGFSAKWT